MSETAPDFTAGPLYAALVKFLPTFVQDLHSEKPKLNVRRLHKAVRKSHEGVYKWLRTDRLTPKNAEALVSLANEPSNLEVLASLKRTPPTINDFMQFVFA